MTTDQARAPRTQQRTTVRKPLTRTRRNTTRRGVENDDFRKMVTRMIRSYGRRVARADMEDFASLIDLHRIVDEAAAEAVIGLRHDGYSWAAIGEAVGITKQSAHERWGGHSGT